MKLGNQGAIGKVEQRQRNRLRLPAIGLLEAMRVTLRAMLSRAVTVHYPEERMELPPRTRGVIALLEENCTVCMLCSKECPCWCIYIEGHKETKPGRRKPVNALDRFAIDFNLCMYCGICVEVCPFDALHWSPNYEYSSFTMEGLVHERDVLSSWEGLVLAPPELVDDADPKAREAAALAHRKRSEGVAAVIREDDKRRAYLDREAAEAAGPVLMPAHSSGDTVPAAPAGFGAASPVAVSAEATTPRAPQNVSTVTTPSAQGSSPPAVAQEVVASHAAASTIPGVPMIDPMALPDNLTPVERGRMKRLAALQREGRPIPADLVANVRHVLDVMG